MRTHVLLAAITIVAVGCLKSSTPENPSASKGAAAPVLEVSVAEAHDLIQTGTVTVLDVRTPREFDAGHIEGAVNIDFRAPDFAGQIDKLDRAQPYVLHCQSGGRSARALKVMREQGFEQIHHMAGGYRAWEAERVP